MHPFACGLNARFTKPAKGACTFVDTGGLGSFAALACQLRDYGRKMAQVLFYRIRASHTPAMISEVSAELVICETTGEP